MNSMKEPVVSGEILLRGVCCGGMVRGSVWPLFTTAKEDVEPVEAAAGSPLHDSREKAKVE